MKKRRSFLQALGLGALAAPTLFTGTPIKDIEKIELPKVREDLPLTETVWAQDATIPTTDRCYILEGKRRIRISTKETEINVAVHREVIPDYIQESDNFDRDFPPISLTVVLTVYNIRKKAQQFVEDVFHAGQKVTILICADDFEIEFDTMPDHIIFSDETRPFSSCDAVFTSKGEPIIKPI